MTAADESQTQRLFIGVPLPAEGVALALDAQGALPSIAGLRPLAVEQLHVTLAFLGEVGAGVRDVAREMVLGLDPALGGVCRLGGFVLLPSPRKVRVVALGVADAGGVFEALYEAIVGGLEAAGVMQREKRPFRPHVTIARLREPQPVLPKAECRSVMFPVESVCLYRSELRREGALYSIIEQRDLSTGVAPVQ